jgi:ATP-binding cassette subfamily F protein 3
MAVVIASNLRKEFAGNVLFDGVSFSVERRDRVALSGPNGAGKTTLLRILSGETEKHGGELAFESEMGRGTTFTIRLPIAGRVKAPVTEAA